MIKKNLHKKTKAQGMTEYLILVALMAIAAIAVTRTTAKNMKIGFGKIANALQGDQTAPAQYDRVDQTDVAKSNLRDFNQKAGN